MLAEADYWREKLEEVLTGGPSVFRPPFEPLVSKAEAFHALCQSTRRLKSKEGPFSCFVGDGELVARQARYFPLEQDGTLEQFITRVEPLLGGQELGFQIKQFHTLLAPETRARLNGVLQSVFEFAGVPLAGVGSDFFAGRYHQTPFGIHLDPAHVFHFVIEGRKRMRLWEYDYFHQSMADAETLKDYDEHLAHSMVLEGEPGDVMYWPPQYWHVGETDGEPSAAVSLALFYTQHDLTSGIETGALSSARQHLPGQRFATAVPDAAAGLRQTLKQFSRTYGRAWKKVDLEREASIAAMDLLSGYAFRRKDPLRTQKKLRLSNSVRLVPGMRILHATVGQEELVSANGRSHTGPQDREVSKVVKRLLTGRPARVSELVGTQQRTRHSRLLLLQKLLSYGAIDLEQSA